jgi:hypothetical protein
MWENPNVRRTAEAEAQEGPNACRSIALCTFPGVVGVRPAIIVRFFGERAQQRESARSWMSVKPLGGRRKTE